MKKNRKRVDGFVFPVPFAGALIIVATLSLAYVWMGCRCETLGREIKALEEEKELLQKKFYNEEYRWTQMKSPGNLERVLAKHDIKMIWPSSSQIVRISPVLSGQASRMVTKVGQKERAVMNE